MEWCFPNLLMSGLFNVMLAWAYIRIRVLAYLHKEINLGSFARIIYESTHARHEFTHTFRRGLTPIILPTHYGIVHFGQRCKERLENRLRDVAKRNIYTAVMKTPFLRPASLSLSLIFWKKRISCSTVPASIVFEIRKKYTQRVVIVSSTVTSDSIAILGCCCCCFFKSTVDAAFFDAYSSYSYLNSFKSILWGLVMLYYGCYCCVLTMRNVHIGYYCILVPTHGSVYLWIMK